MEKSTGKDKIKKTKTKKELQDECDKLNKENIEKMLDGLWNNTKDMSWE